MKLFCSYAFTGEDEQVVADRMRLVVSTLRGAGHEVYCNLFDEHVATLLAANDIKSILRDAFEHLAECDEVIAIVTSPRRSVGQNMELGVALNDKKPIHLFEHVSAKNTSYLELIADSHHAWESNSELVEALKSL